MKQKKGNAYHPLVDEAAGLTATKGPALGYSAFTRDVSTHAPTSCSPRRSPPQAVTFPHQGPLAGGVQALSRQQMEGKETNLAQCLQGRLSNPD